MQITRRLCFLGLVTVMPLAGWSADVVRVQPADDGRVVHAERHFGDIRFVMGSGQAMRWLEMYAGTNLVAAFRGFDAEEVRPSPDGQYFLAVSNSHLSTMTFAVLDRQGHIVFSAPYQTSSLRHCPGTAAIQRHWMDAANLQARFELAQSQTDPAHREYLQSVTVRGCDGRDTLLGQAVDPGPPPVELRATRLMPSAPGPASGETKPLDRGTFFIGTAIENLRGLDPTFGGRTLTLIDGRRPRKNTQEQQAQQAPQQQEQEPQEAPAQR